MKEKAAKVITETIYAAVASCTKTGEPWNSPVFVVYDEFLNFYWASSASSQHSRNLRSNSKVFLAIYDSSAPWGTGQGVFIEAEAMEVSDPYEIARACQLRKARVPSAKQPPESFIGARPRRIYRATPKRVWVNQDGQTNGFFVDERVEIELFQLQDTVNG